MPLFEFRCSVCHEDVELLVRREEQPTCPKCGGKRMEKLLSVAAAPAGMTGNLPLAGGCPPSDAPPCRPGCCRLP